MEQDYISLKWGSLKAWDIHSDAGLAILKQYFDMGVSSSAIMQKDKPEQKEILCRLIDECDAKQIHLEWDDEFVSKDEAKEYVRNG